MIELVKLTHQEAIRMLKNILLLLAIMLICWGCSDNPKEPVAPQSHAPDTPAEPFPADGAEFVPSESLELHWSCDDQDGDISYYVVYYGTTANFSDSIIVNESICVINDLEPQTLYFWQIAAFDSSDLSSLSPIWTFSTINSADIYFREDFSGNIPYEWNFISGDWMIRNGSLYQTMDIIDTIAAAESDTIDFDPANGFRLQVNTRLVEGKSFNIRGIGWIGGINTRITMTFDTTESKLNMHCRALGFPLGWQQIDIAPSIWEGSDSLWHKLGIRVLGNICEFYFDGNVIYSLEDPKLYDINDSGKIRLSVKGAEAAFDDIAVVKAGVGGVPNHPPYEPANPIPEDGAAGAATDNLQLQWTGGDPDGNPVRYTLRWGSMAMENAVTNLSQSEYVLNDLSAGTVYYWQILVVDCQGLSAAGPIWSFTTAEE